MQTSSNVVVCFGMTWKQSAITFTKVLLKNFGYLNKEYYKKLKSGGLSNAIGFVEAGKWGIR